MIQVKKDLFQGLADPTRRAIIMLLATQTMTPNAIAAQFNLTRQGVSKHIQVLVECDLLVRKKSGREIYYHLDAAQMDKVEQWLAQFRARWAARFEQLDEVLTNMNEP